MKMITSGPFIKKVLKVCDLMLGKTFVLDLGLLHELLSLLHYAWPRNESSVASSSRRAAMVFLVVIIYTFLGEKEFMSE